MGHKKRKKDRHQAADQPQPKPALEKPKLELVVKCDTDGCLEAVCGNLAVTVPQEVELDIIHQGIGAVSKSDLLAAQVGSKLVVGFNIGMLPKLEPLCKEYGVETRLYTVIYKLCEDVKEIALSLLPREEETEKILGSAKVIALFKSCRHGIILGCEVEEGQLRNGARFRVISGMGPIYTGKIESLQIDRTPVNKATIHQQAGIKIREFDKAKVGDLVECFQALSPRARKTWQPSGRIFHL